MKKSDNLANWRAMRGARVNPLPLMRALPYRATGSTYGADGVRVDGSPAFIDAVLSCLTDLLPGESNTTRLDFSRKDVKPISGKTWENSAAGAQVCYIRLRERGPVARILRGAGYVSESVEKSNGEGPRVVEPPALPLELELSDADYEWADGFADDDPFEDVFEEVPPVPEYLTAEKMEAESRPFMLLGVGDVRALGYDKPVAEMSDGEKLEAFDRFEQVQRPATYAAEKLASEKRAARVAAGTASPASVAAYEAEQYEARKDAAYLAAVLPECHRPEGGRYATSYTPPACLQNLPPIVPGPKLALSRKSLFAKKSNRAIDKRAKARASRGR